MKLELNLWFNKNHTINGRLNINAGEQVYKFSNMEDIDTFVSKGVSKDILTESEFIQLAEILKLDPDARYAWVDTNFVYWNSLKKVAYAFYESDIYTLKLNTRYNKTYSSQPDTCFEVVV